MALIINGKKYDECEFNDENELESIIVKESKNIFGQKSIYINAKRKIGTHFLGGGISDGYLFDFGDDKYPKFYLVEVELKSHDYKRHIHDQLMRFSAFYDSSYYKDKLIDELYEIVRGDQFIRDEFIKHSGNQEIYKSIKEMINNCRNILIVINGLTNEIRTAIYNERDRRADFTKYLIFKKFEFDSEIIYATFSPDNDIEPMHYDKPQNLKQKRNISFNNNLEVLPKGSKDTTKYLFKGRTYGKSRLVLAIVSDYATNHPNITFDELKNIFPDSLQGSPNGVFIHKDQAMEIIKRTGHRRHFTERDEILTISHNIKIAVCTQWGANLNIERFIQAARSLGYDIKESK